MLLDVYYQSTCPGAGWVWYCASPKGVPLDELTERQLDHMGTLSRRIELVGKHILADDLEAVDLEGFSGAIGMRFTKGISSGPKRLDFRSFIGWVEIFDAEIGLATRAAMPSFR